MVCVHDDACWYVCVDACVCYLQTTCNDKLSKKHQKRLCVGSRNYLKYNRSRTHDNQQYTHLLGIIIIFNESSMCKHIHSENIQKDLKVLAVCILNI